ncbi:hypothetical protein SAMN05444411_106153 [Lutibacter oricola]|uniref:Uncharacterized protein n=1 Tax=Lutibacter oricola TaxID=762486 RepID=A0A1H3CHA2_9FLAO|nr:YeeE/YedE thiosulfate transporter family protein [Lutibacter oricola]SDX52964.1 hypothetical protein SAMN05444411_106153 [Lutibacter oricola]
MGPLIPNEIIPYEWNNIIAILIGIAFGFVLESSGFSSSRKLAGVFYGYDFAVLKVFFTAAVTAAIGLYYMDYLGYVNLGELYVQPTYLWGGIIGGAIMGVGFISAGFCPGTALTAVAIGKIDAIVYIVGIMIGVFIFAEAYSIFQPLYEGSYLGNITVVDYFGANPYWFIFGLTVVAVLAFFVTDIIRRRVKKVFY